MTVFLLLSLVQSAAAQISGQSFGVTPEVDSATVGDSVTLRFRVRLDERDLLLDTVPQPVVAPPPGVRILSVEKLVRTPDRIFQGRARIAFYRIGRRAVPVFGLPFMRGVKGLGRGILPSDSAFVQIVSLLPAGNPSLKDIREIEVIPPRSPWLFLGPAIAALLLLAGYVGLGRRRARVALPMKPAAAVPAVSPTAYATALAQLERIERAQWPEHGEVTRHYEAIVDVLRGYLEATERLPARERTSEELVWAIPPHLSENGLRDQLRELLDQADLVKFARRFPRPEAAQEFLRQCRTLLRHWHGASPTEVLADALR